MPAYDTSNSRSMNQTRYVVDNHRDKMRGTFYNSWIPHWMWVMDLFLFIVVCVGVGIARDADGYRPWQMAVYRIEDFPIVKDAIADYADIANWSPTMTDVQIDTVVRGFRSDIGITMQHMASSTYIPLFVECMTNASKTLVRKELTAPFGEGDEKKFKERAWECVRNYRTPSHISIVTTINVLLCLLIWCVHALVARSFANLAMTDKIHEVPTDTGVTQTVTSMTSTSMSLASTVTSGLSFLLALAVLGWTMFENVDADGDFAAANIILLFIVFLGIVYSGIVVFRSRNPRPWSDVTGLTAEDFNAAWTIVAFMKPLVVAPVYTCIVLSLSGITELYSLVIATVLSFTLAFISASISYSNLYATHRDRSDAYNNSLSAKPLTQEQLRLEQKRNDMRMQKARRPMNVIITALIVLCVISFTSWPRRMDVGVLWGIEFTIFFLLLGLGSMVLPDVIFHRRFNQAMVMREQAEIVFRTLVVLMVLSFVF